MQKFWYHSPVRFYKSLDDLQDMTNPQNTQYFGTPDNPYPLEMGKYHRFLIPMYENEVSTDDLELWCGNVQISAKFGVFSGKLERVTFMHDDYLSGNLTIKSGDDILFHSNCIRFTDSEDGFGRKFIRIATKHYYNRALFNFENNNNWFVTNLPAYCLGQFRVDSEVNNARTGGNSTLSIKETYLDEAVSYQFLTSGDANILSFIQVHTSNTDFYIDGTKRTLIEKITPEEYAMSGIMNFTNQKDDLGVNILLNEDDIFSDFFKYFNDFYINGIDGWVNNGGASVIGVDGLIVISANINDGIYKFFPQVKAGSKYRIEIETKALSQDVYQFALGFSDGQNQAINISSSTSEFAKSTVEVIANTDADAVILYSLENGVNDFTLKNIKITEIL